MAFNLYYLVMFLIFISASSSSTATDTLLSLLHCEAPGNPTRLSRHWFTWVALYIEWSQRFDIRKRPQHCNPVNPPPYTLFSSPSLHLWLTHKHTASSNVGNNCSLLFHQSVQRLNIQDGGSGWKQQRGKWQRAIKSKLLRIMVCTGKELLTNALMEKPHCVDCKNGFGVHSLKVNALATGFNWPIYQKSF